MQTVDPSADDVRDHFQRVARRMRRAMQTALEPCGVSPHQARALRMVVREGSLRPSQLAESLGIALRSTTQVVDDLVAAGLLSRHPDPSDRRAVLVSATEAGHQLAARIAEIRSEQSQQFTSVLSEQDRAELRRILVLLEEALEQQAAEK